MIENHEKNLSIPSILSLATSILALMIPLLVALSFLLMGISIIQIKNGDAYGKGYLYLAFALNCFIIGSRFLR